VGVATGGKGEDADNGGERPSADRCDETLDEGNRAEKGVWEGERSEKELCNGWKILL